MAKTAAERQREFRERRRHKIEAGEYLPKEVKDIRLDRYINRAAYFAMEDIAKFQGVTCRALLERLLLEEETRIISQLIQGSPEWCRYISPDDPEKALRFQETEPGD